MNEIKTRQITLPIEIWDVLDKRTKEKHLKKVDTLLMAWFDEGKL